MKATRLAIDGGEAVRDNYLVFGSPMIGDEEVAEVVECLRSGWIGTGPRAARFQELIARYVGARFGLAVNSCTSALHLALLAAGVGPGDEVIVPSMTFCATVNVVVHTGATPVLVDCDPLTMNVDPGEVDRAITPRTKAIIPVHMAGRPCQMDALFSIARRHGVALIEDAAHALGAEYHGQRIGSLSDATAFSFYATKNLATGEGGLIATNDEAWADTAALYSLHGMSADAWKRYSDHGHRHYLVEAPGFKYNMTDLVAAIGLRQFERFDQMQVRRAQIWRCYDEALQGLPLQTPPPPEPDTVHAHHLYTILLDLDRLTVDRDAFQHALHRENIGTGVHFVAVHLHPYYRDRFGFSPEAFPHSHRISQRTLSLPLSAKLTDADVADVVAAVRKVANALQA